MSVYKDNLLKKLLYRSWHRGCKETDILLGNFARLHLQNLNEEQIKIYADLIMEDDADLYHWLSAENPIIPKKYQQLVKLIREKRC